MLIAKIGYSEAYLLKMKFVSSFSPIIVLTFIALQNLHLDLCRKIHTHTYIKMYLFQKWSFCVTQLGS